MLLAIALVGGGAAFWYHSTGPSAGTSTEAPANAKSVLDVTSAVKTPPAPSVGQLEGRLKLDPIQITVPNGASKAPVILSSRVSNQSNRLQHSITLRVTLSTEDGLAVASRKYPCCSDETADPVEVEKVRLKPGQSVDYKIKMPVPKLPSAKLKATAELLFAETEIVPELVVRGTRRFLRRLFSVPELSMRVALWAEYFSQHHPDENLELVKFALQARSQGHHAGVVAMMAFSRLVLDHRALIQRRLLPAAVVQNTTAVLELVVQRGPLKSVEVSSVRVPRIMPDRDLTLGERRTRAERRPKCFNAAAHRPRPGRDRHSLG